jgi:hypothetical protein
VPDTATGTANGAPDVDDAFRAALEHDAAVTPPEMPAPPRKTVSADPDAPHGREEDGSPKAPYGLNKKTGRPNLKPGGPGRPVAGDKPRVTTPAKAPATPGKGGQAPDYAADLAGLAATVWIGASAMQGGRVPLLGIPIPDARPYAMLWHEQTPQLVGAWNTAAQQNATIRGWVEKLAGEGSWQWVIGVSVVSANFLAGCTELAKKDNAELRANYAHHNDLALKEFLSAQVEAQAPEPEEVAA